MPHDLHQDTLAVLVLKAVRNTLTGNVVTEPDRTGTATLSLSIEASSDLPAISSMTRFVASPASIAQA